MKVIFLLFLVFLGSSSWCLAQKKSPIVIVVHGGAGTILKESMTEAVEKSYHEQLSLALEAGYRVLQQGGTSVEAVIAAVRVLEDSPLFNAGRGAVLSSEGLAELDASLMDGNSLKAGAVAGLTIVKNPILLAQKVMNNSPHVMLVGKGAEQFAIQNGLEIVDNEYFKTEIRKEQLEKIQQVEQGRGSLPYEIYRFGTVGAVALDQYGNLAAGTSTGGMVNKKHGRVGDSPIIGAGTYANNESCAVSCTGHGEYFIRYVVAHQIASLVKYKKYDVQKAGNLVINDQLVKAGGKGGAIILDRKGNFAMPFNTSGMYRGYIDKQGVKKTMIFKS